MQWALWEHNQDWYRDLVEHSRDLLCIHDLQGRLLSVNPAPARVLGYSVEELLQIPMREMIVPEFRDQFDLYLQQIERDGEAHGFMAVVARSGERRILEFHNTLRINGTEPPIVRGFGHDVTEQKRTEAKLRGLLEAAPDATVVADSGARIVLVNAQAERMFGYRRAELLGQRIEMLVPERLREHHFKLRDEFLRKPHEMAMGAERKLFALHKDGHEFEVEINLSPLKTAEGLLVTSAIRDITERNRTEQALRDSEARERAHAKKLEAVLDVLPIPVIIAHDAECRHMTANRMGREYLRLQPGANASMSAPSSEKPRLRFLRDGVEIPADELPMQRAAATGLPVYQMPTTVVFEDGTERHELANAVPLLGEDGEVRGAVGAAIDVTERKRAEEDLRASEERLRLAQEAAKIGTFERNLQTGECRWTPQMEAIYGLPPGGFPRSIEAFLDMVHGSDRASVAQLVEQSIQVGDAEGEWRVVWPDGSLHWIAGRCRLFKDDQGRPMRILGIDFDITDRKRAEDALRASEERFRLFVEHAPAELAMFDREMRYLHASRRWRTDYGLGDRDLRGLSHYEVFPEVPERWKEAHRRGLAGEVLRGENDRFDRADGSVQWIRWEIRPWHDRTGAIGGILIFTEDITAGKLAEEALRTSEERFRVALKSAPINVYNQDCDLRYTWVYNPPEGWKENDYLGKTDDEVFGPEIGARMKALKQLALDRCESARDEVALTVRGKTFHYDMTVEPLRDTLGRVVGVNCACVDVTPMRQVMDELRIAKEKLAEEKFYLEQEIDAECGFEEIVGQSAALKEVMGQVGQVAASDATVLLLGETGTGKELVARALHRLGRRAGSSFIKMNCAAIPSGLLESELFGYEKGAFTGAVGRKLGRLELADKGTLFLDEIGEIPLTLQPKLLRVLQDQEFERLGGTQTLKVDFRLIAATNRDLAESVRKNEFRSDLYYRLNVFPVRVPPLRERRDDVRLLVEHFVQKCAKRMNKKITSIPKRTIEMLMQWDWPGNVRELENFVERSVILTHGSVLVSPLSELRIAAEAGVSGTLEAAEREHILRALRESHGQIGGPRGAAARLGLKRTTLQSKLKHLGIDRRPPAAGP